MSDLIFKRPMLAGTVDDIRWLTYPLLATPKIDGIRCMVQHGMALTRSLKPIPNHHIRTLVSKLPDGLDGELVAGKNYHDTESAVMTVSGTPDFAFIVFDIMKDDPYHVRAGAVQALLLSGNCPQWARPLIAQRIHDYDDLVRFEQFCLDRGYEGVILRSPNGPYKHGRSTQKESWMLKLKRFIDAEARIIGVEPLYRNLNPAEINALGLTERSSAAAGKVPDELLGCFRVVDLSTNAEFSVGTGYSQAMRREYWEKRDSMVGRIITYKFMPHGTKDKPRHPVFKGFRSDLQ